MAARNIKKLLKQAQTMPTAELCRSELIELYDIAGTDLFECLCKSWEAGYAAGYNRALKEVKKAQKKERGL